MERVDYQPLLIQDLINLRKNKELDLNPWYQRRSVWSDSQRAYLVNTLFVRMPVPSIYIRYAIDIENEKVAKEVVDGQQRCRAILDFYDGTFSARHPEHKKRVKFTEMTSAQRTRFVTTPLSVGYLVEATDQDVIEMFGRVNSVSKTLNDHERRNAKFSGAFKQFCLEQASARLGFWRTYNIFTPSDISRMTEVGFLSDLVLNLIRGLQDYSPKALDDVYATYEDDFPEQDSIELRISKIFDILVSLKSASIKDTVFSRSPVLFSLMLLLDARADQVDTESLEDRLFAVDRRFANASDPDVADPQDYKFRDAVVQTSQRIKNRLVRAEYLETQLF